MIASSLSFCGFFHLGFEVRNEGNTRAFFSPGAAAAADAAAPIATPAGATGMCLATAAGPPLIDAAAAAAGTTTATSPAAAGNGIGGGARGIISLAMVRYIDDTVGVVRKLCLGISNHHHCPPTPTYSRTPTSPCSYAES